MWARVIHDLCFSIHFDEDILTPRALESTDFKKLA